LEFVITDHKADILVKYTGVLPDLFKEGQGVVVLGVLKAAPYGRHNHFIFEANQILAKHDENYTPPIS